MKTIGEILNHDFKKGDLKLYDLEGKCLYYETPNRYWDRREFDLQGNCTYFKDSNGFWREKEFDSYGNCTYSKDSNGVITGTKKGSCEGKVVEIEGKKYKLTELKEGGTK